MTDGVGSKPAPQSAANAREARATRTMTVDRVAVRQIVDREDQAHARPDSGATVRAAGSPLRTPLPTAAATTRPTSINSRSSSR